MKKYTFYNIIILTIINFYGCYDIQNPTYGEFGVVKFAYKEGICYLGCSADAPMSPNSRVEIRVVNASSVPAFVVSSDNPAVADFSYNSGENLSTITVNTHETGKVKLILTNASTGQLIDRLSLEVHDIAKIDLSYPEDTNRIVIMEGGVSYLLLDLMDKQNNQLKGIGGVSYQLSEGLQQVPIVQMEEIIKIQSKKMNEQYCFMALTKGTKNINISTSKGVSLNIPVIIVDVSAVNKIELKTIGPFPLTEGGFSDIYILAKAWSINGEEIISPLCNWSIESNSGSIYFKDTKRELAIFNNNIEGNAIVVCSIGNVTQKIDLKVAALNY